MYFARRKYLRGVDRIVIQNLKDIHAERLLDIGAGDGRRSKYLSDTLGIKQVIAVESSLKMAAEAREQLGENNVLVGDATKIEFPEEHFDAVVCLWNVLGHISNEWGRIEVLRKISKSLKPNGKCIIDVNNRYNSRHYGWMAVFRNAFNDLIRKMDSGWFPLQVNGVEGKVYIHRPADIRRYLTGINLKVERTYYIDYESGVMRKMPWKGQSVYVLSRIE
jgi:SAM-dependent methyltransferase